MHRFFIIKKLYDGKMDKGTNKLQQIDFFLTLATPD